MSETPEFLTRRLIEDGDRTQAFFRALTPEQWDRTVYSEGASWTTAQVLAHFVAAEHSLCRLVTNIQEGGAGTPEDFKLDAYNERKVSELSAVPRQALMERFLSLRQETAAVVSRLLPADLARTGRHPFLGSAPLVEIIKLIYRHNQIHIREIKQGFPKPQADEH